MARTNVLPADAPAWVTKDRQINELIYSESRATMHKITDTFDNSTQIALIVPGGNYDAEKSVIGEIEKLDKEQRYYHRTDEQLIQFAAWRPEFEK